MDKSEHLTPDELILFLDRELETDAASIAEQHLLECRDCEQRLQRLKAGSNAYAQYRETVLEPALQVPASGWARLSQLAPNPAEEKRRRLGWVWAVACACGLALAFVYWRMPEQPSAQEVLTRAEAAPPVPATASLLLTTGPNRLFRPAVFESGHSEARFQHVRALFVQANYSWENPLNAHSFSAWRARLPQKEDSVTSVREQSGRKFYRLQTRTGAGVLRSASLTLQAETYHPTKAEFVFEGEEPVQLSEQTELPKNGLEVVQQPAVPSAPLPAAETPATPEDELRVFAALDAMGAEAEEPIDVKMDTEYHAVVVSGIGLPPARRKEIEAKMAELPHTAVRFTSGPRLSGDPNFINPPNTNASDESLTFRQNLQDRYGGARQLQAATDKALDASNGLFARAHLLLLLAREFPPAVVLSPASHTKLLALRQHDVETMEDASQQLRQDLVPLLPAGSATETDPNGDALALFTSARNLDRTVTRLLSGRYSDEEGNGLLKQLPTDLSKVEALLRAQSSTNAK